MFWFIDDPEGPNLLVVVVTAGIVYFLSLIVSLFYSYFSSTSDKSEKSSDTSSSSSPKSFLSMILIQILVVMGLYFLLKFI